MLESGVHRVPVVDNGAEVDVGCHTEVEDVQDGVAVGQKVGDTDQEEEFPAQSVFTVLPGEGSGVVSTPSHNTVVTWCGKEFN